MFLAHHPVQVQQLDMRAGPSGVTVKPWWFWYAQQVVSMAVLICVR